MLSQNQQGGQFTGYMGVAAEDKDPFSRELKVYCQELLPFLEGKLQDATATKAVTAGTENSNDYLSKVDTSNVVTATYFDGFTNRSHPPDVRQGEQVLVLNYADTDKYYWFSLGRNDNLRTRERFRFAASDKPNQSGELDDNNTYYLEVDTLHHKHLVISTSKSDGELHRYLFKIDVDNSKVFICDDVDNEILLESEIPRIRSRNKDGTMVDLVQKNLVIVAPEDIILKAGRQIVYDSPLLTGSTQTGDAVTKMIVKDLAIAATDTMTITAPSIGFDGAVHAKNIVAGPIQATGYSTGSPGAAYTPGNVDVGEGKGTNGNNTPNYGGGSDANRHAAAWEQVQPALEHIAQCLDDIHARIGGGCDTSIIVELAARCRMPKNRGE